MNAFLLTAGALSGITCCIHFYFGGRNIAKPLLQADDIRDVPKYTNYYCWHLVTAMLASMSAAFVWAGLMPSAIEAAVIAEMLAVFSAVWSLALVRWKKQSVLHMPQWTLFLAITGAGLPGFLP